MVLQPELEIRGPKRAPPATPTADTTWNIPLNTSQMLKLR